MQASDELVLVTVSGGVARIRFNRPRALNAIDTALARRWRDAVREVRSRADVRAVVLSGEGRAFMAGGDLRAFHDDLSNAGATAKAIIDAVNKGLLGLAQGDAPVIASVHGAVAGAGMSIALGADLCVAASDTVFNLAYARIGASPDAGGSWYLPRIVGLRRAMSIALLPESIPAIQALQLGLVNRVVPEGSLESETEALAARLAQGPTSAFGRIRRLLRASFEHDLAGQLAAERDAFVQGAETKEFRDGVDAFVNKRAPVFNDSKRRGVKKVKTANAAPPQPANG